MGVPELVLVGDDVVVIDELKVEETVCVLHGDDVTENVGLKEALLEGVCVRLDVWQVDMEMETV